MLGKKSSIKELLKHLKHHQVCVRMYVCVVCMACANMQHLCVCVCVCACACVRACAPVIHATTHTHCLSHSPYNYNTIDGILTHSFTITAAS